MTTIKDIKELKKRGFSVRKAPNKDYYTITYIRHGNLLIHRNLKYNKIKDFVKEVKKDERSYFKY
jgi:hypothetical protein